MIYLINESSVMARRIHNYVPFDKSKIQIISTNGFLYRPVRDVNGNLEVFVANPKTLFKLDALKNSLKNDDIVVIATDHDPAGEYIALELLDLFPHALRYKNRMDDFVFQTEVLPEVVLRDSGREYFNEALALDFMQERLRNNPLRAKKEAIMDYILSHEDNDSLVIPAKYSEVLKAL